MGTALSHIVGYNYNSGGAVIDGGLVTGSTVTGLATDNITWGKSKILNIGIDLGFLDNRLNASFDYFNRDQTGLLASRYDVQIPEEVEKIDEKLEHLARVMEDTVDLDGILELARKPEL